MPRFTVYSSNGHLAVDLKTGVVDVEKSSYDNEELKPITKFDLKEYESYWGTKIKEGEGIDILNLGQWEGEKYVPAVDHWREEVKAMRAEEAQKQSGAGETN